MLGTCLHWCSGRSPMQSESLTESRRGCAYKPPWSRGSLGCSRYYSSTWCVCVCCSPWIEGVAEQKLLWKVIIKQLLLIHLNSTVYSEAVTVVGLTQEPPLPVVNFPVKQSRDSLEAWCLAHPSHSGHFSLPRIACFHTAQPAWLSPGCLTPSSQESMCFSHTGHWGSEIWEVSWRWKTPCAFPCSVTMAAVTLLWSEWLFLAGSVKAPSCLSSHHSEPG